MLICCVYPQLIITSCLKCCLICCKQVQVFPIDPLQTPTVARTLSSCTEPKKRRCSKSISLPVSPVALLKSTLPIVLHWECMTQCKKSFKYKWYTVEQCSRIDNIICISCLQAIWLLKYNLNTPRKAAIIEFFGLHISFPLKRVSCSTWRTLQFSDRTKHCCKSNSTCK